MKNVHRMYDMTNIQDIKENIYITNDEEIKEGDWYYDDFIKQIIIADNRPIGNDCKKIILTTDQDLIKDGVQAIDDEFLEWFVKNPSCEEVRVGTEIWNDGRWNYFLPKEESKQETLEEAVKTYYEKNIDQSNIPREHYEWKIQDFMLGFGDELIKQLKNK